MTPRSSKEQSKKTSFTFSRREFLAAGTIAALVFTLGIGWKEWRSLPWDEQEYLRRWFTYKNSDIKDYYAVFPNAVLPKAVVPMSMEQKNNSDVFAQLKIEHKGKKVILPELLKNSQTTAFIVVKDGTIVYESYPSSDYTAESINPTFALESAHQ